MPQPKLTTEYVKEVVNTSYLCKVNPAAVTCRDADLFV